MNLIDEAESLMLHQFRNSPKLIGLIRSLVVPLDELDQLFQSMHHGRYIYEATAHRLDILGSIVGQPGKGMDDDDYRAWINVAIRLNIGSGRAEDVLAILSILYSKSPEVELQERPPNHIVFTFLSCPKVPLKALFSIIRSAVPVASNCHFIRAEAKPIFRFDSSNFSNSALAEYFWEQI